MAFFEGFCSHDMRHRHMFLLLFSNSSYLGNKVISCVKMFDNICDNCQVSLHLIRFPSEQLIQGDWRDISSNPGGSTKGVISEIE